MINTVIFDADGVVSTGNYFITYIEKDFGISKESVKDFFDSEIFVDCITGKKELKKELLPFLNQWGWKRSIDDFLDYWHTKEHVIDTDLIAYIQKLRSQGVTCCLATNQNRYRFNYMVNEMGFGNAFDRLYASDFLGYKKPSSEFFTTILGDLKNSDPKKVLFWDDRKENIKAAKLVGIHAEIYTDFITFQDTMKDYLTV